MKYPTGDVRASHLRSASLPRRRSAMASCTHLHIFIVSSSRPTRLRRAARPPPFTFPRGTARRARRPRVARRPETSRLVREWTPSHPPTPTRRVWVVTRRGMNSATVGCTPSLASRFASTPLFRSRSNASSSSRTRRGSASSETTPATRQVTRQRTSLSSRLLRLSRCRTTSIRGASSPPAARRPFRFFFGGADAREDFPRTQPCRRTSAEPGLASSNGRSRVNALSFGDAIRETVPGGSKKRARRRLDVVEGRGKRSGRFAGRGGTRRRRLSPAR